MELVVDESKKEIETEALSIQDKARALVIETQEDYDKADTLKIFIKKMEAKIDETFGPIIKKAHEAHKEAVAQRKNTESPFLEAKAIITPKMTAFLVKQEEKRKAVEDAIRLEMLKKAQEEQIAMAVEAESHGEKEVAEKIINEEVYVPPVIVPRANVQKGVSLKSKWKWELIDFSLLENEYKMTDDVKINRVVKALNKSCNIPGIRVYEEKDLDDRRSAKNL